MSVGHYEGTFRHQPLYIYYINYILCPVYSVDVDKMTDAIMGYIDYIRFHLTLGDSGC